MKVGDYVRTKHYGISKITDIYNKDKIELDKVNAFGIRGVCYMVENIIKSSPNIIDLIQVGDYVNGILITIRMIDNIGMYFNDIKSIVTKEQFESMEYNVGE